MLHDSFERRFSYLRLSLTEQCNFRCGYCLPDGSQCGRSRELDLLQIRHLVRAFAQAGIRKVRLTGGEPSLRKDLCDIIELVKSTPGIEQVALTTNGYRLKKDIQRYLDAGLDALNVSIDSLDPATFALITGQDRLDDILQGVDLALQLGCPQVKLNTVLLKEYNAGALPDFLQFIRDKPVTLRFIELMQTGQGNSYFQRQHLSASQMQQQLQQQGWSLLAKTPYAGPALEFIHPEYAGRIGLIRPYSDGFCQSCNRLRVSSTGQLFLCLFATEHQDLRPWLTKPEGLQQFLQQVLKAKTKSHALQQGQTGLTRNFAMIGG